MKKSTSQHSSSPVSDLTSNLEDATKFANSAREAQLGKVARPSNLMDELMEQAMREVAERELLGEARDEEE
jgi:hypothetical protein